MAAIETALGRIGVSETGSGGTPIVFLHGVGSDRKVWARQLDHFGARRRAVAFDYPGYGDSAPAREGMSRDDYAEAILAAMDALDIGAAHVCGLSLGGVVAIAIHAAAPERCESLIIADSFAVHPDGQGIYERGRDGSRTIGMKALAEARAPLLLGSDASDALRAEVIGTMAGIDPAAFRVGLEAVWLADQRARVAAIRVPALVIVGDEDQVTPPALSSDLAEEIGGARMHVIDGAGHLSNIEKPAEFNSVVEDFLVETDSAPGQRA